MSHVQTRSTSSSDISVNRSEIRRQDQGARREYGDELKGSRRRVSICSQPVRVQSAEINLGGAGFSCVLFQNAHTLTFGFPYLTTRYSTSVIYPLSIYSCPITGAPYE